MGDNLGSVISDWCLHKKREEKNREMGLKGCGSGIVEVRWASQCEGGPQTSIRVWGVKIEMTRVQSRGRWQQCDLGDAIWGTILTA